MENIDAKTPVAVYGHMDCVTYVLLMSADINIA